MLHRFGIFRSVHRLFYKMEKLSQQFTLHAAWQARDAIHRCRFTWLGRCYYTTPRLLTCFILYPPPCYNTVLPLSPAANKTSHPFHVPCLIVTRVSVGRAFSAKCRAASCPKRLKNIQRISERSMCTSHRFARRWYWTASLLSIPVKCRSKLCRRVVASCTAPQRKRMALKLHICNIHRHKFCLVPLCCIKKGVLPF